jgi:prolyl-tRNA synthetase
MLKSQNIRMLWSRLFIPTLRDNPAGVESVSRRLLLRAGYMRLAAGQLFLGRRVLKRIAGIARRELGVLGAQEVSLGDSTVAVAREIRSYRQLPQIWFEGQEPLRVWWFGLEHAEHELAGSFRRILDRCGLDGATESFESCEPAAGPPSPAAPDPDVDAHPQEFGTPGMRTIAEVAEFDGMPETSHIKTLVMVCDEEPVLVLLRGDHNLSERKLAALMDSMSVRPARPDELREWMKADAGSLGPCGAHGLRIIADRALEGRRNMIAGANKNDTHVRNVTPGRDFSAEFADVRQGAAQAEQIGSIRAFGAKFGERMQLRVTNASGAEVPMLLSTATLSLDGILSMVVERNHDSDGLTLPPAIAPFEVVVTPVNVLDAALRSAAAEIYTSLTVAGFEVLFDDRDERPGVKFKDSDLIGIPWRVTVGKKLPQEMVEVIERRGRKSNDVNVSGVVEFLRERLR